jgi:VWFA-related protein
LLAGLALPLLRVCTVYGQQNPVFRVTSTLVQVDAVVIDSKGRQVPDLTAADFSLYADGKIQKITNFSYVAVSPQATPLPAAKAVAKDPTLAPPPDANIRREDVRRTIVLMVDDLNLSFESLAFVRFSLLKFIDRQMQPGDLIAIRKTGAKPVHRMFMKTRRISADRMRLPLTPLPFHRARCPGNLIICAATP